MYTGIILINSIVQVDLSLPQHFLCSSVNVCYHNYSHYPSLVCAMVLSCLGLSQLLHVLQNFHCLADVRCILVDL